MKYELQISRQILSCYEQKTMENTDNGILFLNEMECHIWYS